MNGLDCQRQYSQMMKLTWSHTRHWHTHLHTPHSCKLVVTCTCMHPALLMLSLICSTFGKLISHLLMCPCQADWRVLVYMPVSCNNLASTLVLLIIDIYKGNVPSLSFIYFWGSFHKCLSLNGVTVFWFKSIIKLIDSEKQYQFLLLIFCFRFWTNSKMIFIGHSLLSALITS